MMEALESAMPETSQDPILGRTWLTLPAALIWAKTRDTSLTEEVLRDPEAFKGIALKIAARIAYKTVHGHTPPSHFENVMQAWLGIRDLIADEKIRAEGQLVERRGLSAGIETAYANGPIPSGEAGNLILLDNWGGFTETVLARLSHTR
jgi:hypothetical protein